MISAEKLIDLAGPGIRGVVDVGAFDGDFSVAASQSHPELIFIGVEPVPERAGLLRERTAAVVNYRVAEVAIAVTEGVAEMLVPHSKEHSTFSSLLPLKEDRADWREVSLKSTVQVRTRPLRDLLGELLPSGDVVLKVDTQGYDLRVIDSLGESVTRVRAGVLETFVHSKHVIYVGAPTRAQTVHMLRNSGFEIVGVESEHSSNHDQNLVFVRRDLLAPYVLWRLVYPLLLARAWLRYLPVRLHVRVAIRTRFRKVLGRHH